MAESLTAWPRYSLPAPTSPMHVRSAILSSWGHGRSGRFCRWLRLCSRRRSCAVVQSLRDHPKAWMRREGRTVLMQGRRRMNLRAARKDARLSTPAMSLSMSSGMSATPGQRMRRAPVVWAPHRVAELRALAPTACNLQRVTRASPTRIAGASLRTIAPARLLEPTAGVGNAVAALRRTVPVSWRATSGLLCASRPVGQASTAATEVAATKAQTRASRAPTRILAVPAPPQVGPAKTVACALRRPHMERPALRCRAAASVAAALSARGAAGTQRAAMAESACEWP
jgi:hypothetical protein